MKITYSNMKHANAYIKPGIKIIEISVEGVVCTSVTVTHEGYSDGESVDLNFSLF